MAAPSVSRTLLRLRQPLSTRAWNISLSATKAAGLRSYSVTPCRFQQQAASVSDGVASHIVDAPAQKVVFEDVSSESVRPAYSGRVPIDIEGNGKPTVFDSIWLRDSCSCPRCVDPSTRQKTFQTPDIPASIRGSAQVTTELEDEDVALISWKDDIRGWPEGHQTALSLDFLRNAISQERAVNTQQYPPSTRTFWDGSRISRDIGFYPYQSYMQNDATLHKVLRALHTHGLVFLRGCPDPIGTPDTSTSVANIAHRIGHLRHTFYGRTWDVRSVPNAKNVAYTHVYLGLHMDLCYLDLTPHLQLLHSMRARAPGGESMFSDSFFAAETIRQESPALFKALCTFPVTFHYYNDNRAYRQTRTTIELLDQSDLSSPIKLLNWSPPFQGPYSHDIGTSENGAALRTFHAATQRFDQLANDPNNMFEYRMEEGDCVIFDNRRVLHARRAFEADKGERWLKGAYLDRDTYASRLEVLDGEFGVGQRTGA